MAWLHRLPCKKIAFQCSLLGALLGLAACGGGKQAETFRPQRMVVFGDEASVLNANGSKYTINALNAAGVLDCSANPLWVQVVAANYGLTFAQCNPANAPVTALMRAAYGAKAQDVQAQVDAFLSTQAPSSHDLASVMVGMHDILAQWQMSPRPSEDAMLAAMDQAGSLMGTQVLRLTQAGVKVLVVTVPDVGKTALGRQASADEQALLRRLSIRLNDKLRVQLNADPNGGGRSGALLAMDDDVDRFVANVGAGNSASNGFGDVLNAACMQAAGVILPDASLPTACTGASANPASGNWLWAGRAQFSAYAHTVIGQLAVARLNANPL